MRFFILSLVCLLSLIQSANASDYKARLKAAEAYEKVTPIDDMMDKMMEQMKKNPPINKHPELLDVMVNAMDKKKIRQETIKLMADSFTLEELDGLADFYSTDVGQSIYKKMPLYAAKAMPLFQTEVARGAQALKKEMAKRDK